MMKEGRRVVEVGVCIGEVVSLLVGGRSIGGCLSSVAAWGCTKPDCAGWYSCCMLTVYICCAMDEALTGGPGDNHTAAGLVGEMHL